MIKILFMIPNLSHGGAEKVLVNLVNNMDKNRFDITVQTLFDTGVNKQFLKPHIRYKFCMNKQFRGNSRILCLFSPKTLYKRFVKESYDIVVSYLEGPTARIVSGCTDPRTKLVSWIHCVFKDKTEAAVGFKNFEEAKKCYHTFHQTACVSQMVMERFKEIFDFKNPAGVYYNTIETQKILELADEKIDDVIFDADTFNLISVGKVISVKGFDRLARIHKKLMDASVKNHVYILGEGASKAEIENYLEENCLRDSFTFLGYKTNPYKYEKAADLYVCSSHSEGFSTSVTESLIVGTPVVTTRVSGMEEMLGARDEFGMVTDNDESALYSGIYRMLTEPGLLEQYACKARERGRFFSGEKTTSAAEKLFINLLK